MHNRIFILVMFSFLFFSCSKSPHEAFADLKNLEGNWKSTGNVLVYDRWNLENDSLLKGVRFSVNNTDTLFIKSFLIQKEEKRILFFVEQSNSEKIPYRTVTIDNHRIIFQQTKFGYPQRVIIGFPDDSTYLYRQENQRGNKSICFKMKRM